MLRSSSTSHILCEKIYNLEEKNCFPCCLLFFLRNCLRVEFLLTTAVAFSLCSLTTRLLIIIARDRYCFIITDMKLCRLSITINRYMRATAFLCKVFNCNLALLHKNDNLFILRVDTSRKPPTMCSRISNSY